MKDCEESKQVTELMRVQDQIFVGIENIVS